MSKEARTFDVAQKADTEAGAQVRPFNEAGQIRDDERAAKLRSVAAGAAVSVDDTEIGFERGKGIIGDLWPGSGNDGDQRRFSSVWEADEAHVGEKFQLEAKMAFFAGESFLMFARGLVPGLGEMLIAASAAATVHDQYALAGRGQIRDDLAGLVVENEGANRDVENHVFPGVAGAIGTFAVAAAIGLEFAIVAIAEESIVIQIGFHIDAAAMASVTSGRTTARHVFLAAESHAAVAAVAGDSASRARGAHNLHDSGRFRMLGRDRENVQQLFFWLNRRERTRKESCGRPPD